MKTTKILSISDLSNKRYNPLTRQWTINQKPEDIKLLKQIYSLLKQKQNGKN